MPWRKARFKGGEVLARCDAQGRFSAENGRVEIRYRPQDGRAYHAALRNLAEAEDAAILPDDAVAPAQAPAAKGGVRRKSAAVVPKHEEDAVIVYADGACSGNPGPAGVGIVILDGKARRELSQYLGEATNNIAELTAIELALQAIETRDRAIRVHTDSQYAIGVLSKGWKAKANLELVARLRKLLAQFGDIELRYVPGHAGVPLNERADALAVEAVERRGSSGWRILS